LLSERHLTVHWQPPTATVEAIADAGKLKQVLRNLLSNAVKFAPKGSTIALAMQHAAQGVVVSVRDQGPGIPEDELETVFDKFVQSSRTKTGREARGSGCQSATRSSRRIRGVSGPPTIRMAGRSLRLSCPWRCRRRRSPPWRQAPWRVPRGCGTPCRLQRHRPCVRVGLHHRTATI
jgi:sensor histidine kinase regulating citrate/malate metabolism